MAPAATPVPPPCTPTPTWSLSLSGNWGKIKIGSSTQRCGLPCSLWFSSCSPGIRAGGLLAVNCREEVGWACCAAVPSPGGRWGPEKTLPPVFLGVPSGQRPPGILLPGPSFPDDSCGPGSRQSEREEQREAWGPLPARRERLWEVCSHWDDVHFRHQLPLLQSLPEVSQHSFSFGGTDLLKRTLRNWPP